MVRTGKDTKERATRIRGFEVRLYPNKEQQAQDLHYFGCKRWIYNWGLDTKSTAYKEEGKSPSKNWLINQLPKLKEEFPWLGDAPSQTLQQALMDLDRASQSFFKKRSEYPKKKTRRSRQSIRFPQGCKVESNRIKLPKLGWIKAKIHRKVYGTVKSVTYCKTSTGKYYASILVDEGVNNPIPPKRIDSGKVRGIDLGLTHLGIADEGDKVTNPRYRRKAEKNLRACHKSVSRKKKGSNNRKKAVIKLAKAYEKYVNVKHDFQHKLSRTWVGESQAICMENLKVKNMLRNRKLAKHISDIGWSSLKSKIRYKSEWVGKHFIEIDTFFASSKTCSECNNKVDSLSLDVRHWTCQECYTVHDRDINAAKNIKREGIRLLQAAGQTVYTCGDSISLARPAFVDEAGSLVL